MKQRYIKRPCLDDISVEYLIGKGFSRPLAEALSARGVNQHNYEQYFSQKLMFHDPFDMVNMRQAVEVITYLMETGGSVLIYGDYDADGLTASSILSLFFTDNGVENNVIIPTRDEGYGLHAENVFRAFERNYYDLILTVDCGISNAEEIQKITDELGVEVIVTDHHELPSVLPDCLCVNPKMGEYPFPNLAGAGVAWKLVEAIAGRETAAKYADLACIGTIGDLMPLTDENRSIVKIGLENFNHKSLRALAELSRCPQQLTASDIAMRIAPRINAAGRVGNPESALSLLLSRDKADNKQANLLMEINEQRKQITEDIVNDALSICNETVVKKEKMVFLYSNKWQHGLLGIVAARFKEKYNLPAIIMTKDGDNYVGSARGIESVDLFDAFCQCQDCLVKFGGHKASVGFSVSVDRVEELRGKLAAIFSSLDESCFEKVYYYDIQLDNQCTDLDVYNLSEMMQPLLPQDKIICRVTDSVKYANAFGKDGAHLSVTVSSGLETKSFFKYGQYASLIKPETNVDLLCSLDFDNYTKAICGTIEHLTLQNSLCFDDLYKVNFFKNFVSYTGEYIHFSQVKKMVAQPDTLLVFDDYETYIEYSKKLCLDSYQVDIFFEGSLSNKTVVISPLQDYPFEKYQQIVVFAKNGMVRPMPTNAMYVQADIANTELYTLQISRDLCKIVFGALKNKSRFESIKGLYDKFLATKLSYCQYVVAIRIFEQLKLIKVVDKYTVEFDSTIKTDLGNSPIFVCLV